MNNRDYVAPRAYWGKDDKAQYPLAYVPAECTYVECLEKFDKNGNLKEPLPPLPHKVRFGWDFDGAEYEIGKGPTECVTHVSLHDEEGLKTIMRICEHKNARLLEIKLAHADKSEHKAIIAEHNRVVEEAMEIAQEHIKDDILSPKEPINLFSSEQ